MAYAASIQPCRALLLFSALALCLAGQAARGEDTVDVGTKVPSVADVQAGLFPEDACADLKAHGYTCMGFKPPVRYSLPAASFSRGSAELPEGIKRQLDVFAQALKGKGGDGRAVRIEGHADASGNPQVNESLSQRRAEAARKYLIAKGVAPEQLKAVGVGSNDLIDAQDPLSARNRRVVIGRDQAPAAAAAPSAQ